MKKELKFYTDLPLFIIVACISWGMSIGFIYVFVITYDPSDVLWWLAVVLTYGDGIGLPIVLYPRLMSKIHLDETGIRKTVIRKSKAQFLRWEEVCDVQVVTRPNGYAYLLVSDGKIECKSFEEALKQKNIIYFTYNEKAVEFMHDQIPDKVPKQ